VPGIGEVERVVGLDGEYVIGRIEHGLGPVGERIDARRLIAERIVFGRGGQQAVGLVEPILGRRHIALHRRRRVCARIVVEPILLAERRAGGGGVFWN
jgi:hypothetical protein